MENKYTLLLLPPDFEYIEKALVHSRLKGENPIPLWLNIDKSHARKLLGDCVNIVVYKNVEIPFTQEVFVEYANELGYKMEERSIEDGFVNHLKG